MQLDELARVPLSVPTYAGILVRTAYRAAQQLDLEVRWQAHFKADALKIWGLIYDDGRLFAFGMI